MLAWQKRGPRRAVVEVFQRVERHRRRSVRVERLSCGHLVYYSNRQHKLRHCKQCAGMKPTPLRVRGHKLWQRGRKFTGDRHTDAYRAARKAAR